MADKFTVQMGEEDYRIVGPDGEEGVMVPYGTLAVLHEDAGNGVPPVYFCLVEDPDDEHPKVYRVDSVSKMPTEAEEVNFPEEVVAAQRRLDEAMEKADQEEESVSDVKATPEVN